MSDQENMTPKERMAALRAKFNGGSIKKNTNGKESLLSNKPALKRESAAKRESVHNSLPKAISEEPKEAALKEEVFKEEVVAVDEIKEEVNIKPVAEEEPIVPSENQVEEVLKEEEKILQERRSSLKSVGNSSQKMEGLFGEEKKNEANIIATEEEKKPVVEEVISSPAVVEKARSVESTVSTKKTESTGIDSDCNGFQTSAQTCMTPPNLPREMSEESAPVPAKKATNIIPRLAKNKDRT